ncbi:hypothetical protein JX265_013253, partial [Neoarthrinium moseri]
MEWNMVDSEGNLVPLYRFAPVDTTPPPPPPPPVTF